MGPGSLDGGAMRRENTGGHLDFGFMDALTWVLADDAHADEVARLVNAAYRGAEGVIGWTSEAHLVRGRRIDSQGVRDLVRAPAGCLLLACLGARVRGCLYLQARDQGEADLGLFAVHPQVQGRGIGARLMAHAEDWMRAHWQTVRVDITVITERADLIAWYHRRGYRLTGEHRPFPYGDARVGEPRRPDLRFAVMQKSLARNSGVG